MPRLRTGHRRSPHNACGALPVAICIDDVTAADRAWFEEHPFADVYRRPVVWGEGADLIVHNPGMVELSESYTSRSRVTCASRVRDDVRLRKFEDVWFMVVPRPGAEELRVPSIPIQYPQVAGHARFPVP